MRLIVLAAGQGFKLDGQSKLLIVDPATRETILDRYVRLFRGWSITVVVGFQATAVMGTHPELDYVFNDQWSITGNSYSLSLALDERPATIVSSDLVFEEELVELLATSPPDAVVAFRSENKQEHTLRCRVDDGRVAEIYMGEPRRPEDLETTGIYKVSDPGLLREWRQRCTRNRSVFAGVNLPLDRAPVRAVDIESRFLHEVNTHLDYLNLIQRRKAASPPETGRS